MANHLNWFQKELSEKILIDGQNAKFYKKLCEILQHLENDPGWNHCQTLIQLLNETNSIEIGGCVINNEQGFRNIEEVSSEKENEPQVINSDQILTQDEQIKSILPIPMPLPIKDDNKKSEITVIYLAEDEEVETRNKNENNYKTSIVNQILNKSEKIGKIENQQMIKNENDELNQEIIKNELEISKFRLSSQEQSEVQAVNEVVQEETQKSLEVISEPIKISEEQKNENRKLESIPTLQLELQNLNQPETNQLGRVSIGAEINSTNNIVQEVSIGISEELFIDREASNQTITLQQEENSLAVVSKNDEEAIDNQLLSKEKIEEKNVLKDSIQSEIFELQIVTNEQQQQQEQLNLKNENGNFVEQTTPPQVILNQNFNQTLECKDLQQNDFYTQKFEQQIINPIPEIQEVKNLDQQQSEADNKTENIQVIKVNEFNVFEHQFKQEQVQTQLSNQVLKSDLSNPSKNKNLETSQSNDMNIQSKLEQFQSKIMTVDDVIKKYSAKKNQKENLDEEEKISERRKRLSDVMESSMKLKQLDEESIEEFQVMVKPTTDDERVLVQPKDLRVMRVDELDNIQQELMSSTLQSVGDSQRSKKMRVVFKQFGGVRKSQIIKECKVLENDMRQSLPVIGSDSMRDSAISTGSVNEEKKFRKMQEKDKKFLNFLKTIKQQ